MKKTFIKTYLKEDNITFYVCFLGQYAIKQIEVSPNKKILLSERHPIVGNSMLYDQQLSDLDLSIYEYISEKQFNEIWNQ